MWCGEQTAAKDDGKSLREIHDTMQQLQPITEQQARNAFRRTIRSAHKKELTGVVKAQATTTKRSAITVEQQYRAVQPAADLAGQSDGDSDEELSSSDEEEVTIADMILACQQEQVEQAIEDPMSDDPELSDDGL